MQQYKFSRSIATINRPSIFYHIIVTKHSRKDNVMIEELRGVKDFLKWHGVNIITKAYHNDGKYGDLHLHIIGTYIGRYSKLKYPDFNICWIALRSSREVPRLSSYIHRGAKLSHRPFRNEKVIIENEHKISEVFLSKEYFDKFYKNNSI